MSMSAQPKRFTEEFKIEAVRQVTERGHRVADVAERLGVILPLFFVVLSSGVKLRFYIDSRASVLRIPSG